MHFMMQAMRVCIGSSLHLKIVMYDILSYTLHYRQVNIVMSCTDITSITECYGNEGKF